MEETVKVENGSSSVETSNNKPSKDNIATDEHLKDGIDADVNNELLEGEVTDGSNEEVFSGEDFEVQPVSPPEAVEKIVEPITDPSSDPVSSPETVSEPAPSSDPVSSPEPTASIIIKKIAKQFESIKRRLVATVSLLTGTEEKIASEESATAEEEITTTTISTETTTTTIVTTTKETMPSTTTTLSEDYENILKEDAEDPGVLSSTTTTKDGNIISNVRHFGVENPELIIRQETQPLSNFKIRGAILKSPDRRAFRSNVEIDELKDEYIINIKHGPELIPGKYDLVIKYNNKKELYNNTISFV